VAGAASAETVRRLLAEAGFDPISVTVRKGSGAIMDQCMPGSSEYVASATIEGYKPGGSGRSCCGPSCCAPEGSGT
jgi:hypothetical protein